MKAVIMFFTMLAFPTVAFAGTSAKYGDGSVVVGYNTGICNAGLEGALRYSSATTKFEYCTGSTWSELVGTGTSTSSTLPGVGYFVITSGTYDGNIGGIAGLNSTCLSDLNANNWMGKADATTRGLLNADHVKAFICGASNKCQNAIPGVTYYFAVSGDAGAGGASFTTDSSGLGPNNAQPWSGSNYFNGGKQYWTGRAAGTATAWPNASPAPSWQACNDFATNSYASGTGLSGVAHATNSYRWSMTDNCDSKRHLVCFVHP